MFFADYSLYCLLIFNRRLPYRCYIPAPPHPVPLTTFLLPQQCYRVSLRFLTDYLSFRSGIICHLVTNLTNELHLLQTLLLFFPVKDGGQRLVCMCNITVQVRSSTSCFWPCVSRMMIFPADTATCTEPCTLMFRFNVGPVFNITEAQCTGIQPVFICRCRGQQSPNEYGHAAGAFPYLG